jgi:hypothetical protein
MFDPAGVNKGVVSEGWGGQSTFTVGRDERTTVRRTLLPRPPNVDEELRANRFAGSAPI